MRRLLLALLVAAGCACGADHLQLEPRWRPLVRIQRDASTPAGIYRTVGDMVLTGDPCDFLAHSEDERTALLIHEQHHALREQELGLAHYLRDFANDRAFRWQEESAGWALQLRYDVQHGVQVDEQLVASFLANGYDGMIGEEQALAWVSSVVRSAR